MLKAEFLPIEKARRWQYKRLVIRDSSLKSWEINEKWGTYASRLDVARSGPEIIITFRKLLKP